MPAGVSGYNRHAATFHAAFILLHGFGLTQEQAWPLLCEFNQRCDPPSDERKLKYRLERADRSQSDKERGFLAKGGKFLPSKQYAARHLPAPRLRPEFSEDNLRKFADEWADKINLLWLAARSVDDPSTISSRQFLEKLYRPNEKVLIFIDWRSQGDSVWPDDVDVPASGADGVWFLAQPVSGNYHPNPRIESMSRRSEEAVTSWRYLVIESDKAKPKLWLGALAQFPLRIAAIYSSGGRSVHALVRIDARTKSEWDKERDAMREALVRLGADPGAMSAVRLTRLPGCYRNRSLQKLLYLNPDPPMRPLLEIPPRRDLLRPWLEWAESGISDADETNGEALTRALNYYAPVSEECRTALKKLSHDAPRVVCP